MYVLSVNLIFTFFTEVNFNFILPCFTLDMLVFYYEAVNRKCLNVILIGNSYPADGEGHVMPTLGWRTHTHMHTIVHLSLRQTCTKINK